MSLENVKNYFKNFDFNEKILIFNESSATVELAAHAVGCEESRIAKTLSFKINDQCILIVTSGDAKIDNSKYKKYFSCKAKMLSSQEVLDMVGHDIGGVCPFAIKPNIKVYLDVSLKRFKTVFPACGSSNSAIELTIEELQLLSNYKNWIDVCKILK